jgi:hypothetical protein
MTVNLTIISPPQVTEKDWTQTTQWYNDISVTTFDDHQFHELDLINIAKLGRQWFESYIKQDQEFEFNFPNIDVSTL